MQGSCISPSSFSHSVRCRNANEFCLTFLFCSHRPRMRLCVCARARVYCLLDSLFTYMCSYAKNDGRKRTHSSMQRRRGHGHYSLRMKNSSCSLKMREKERQRENSDERSIRTDGVDQRVSPSTSST